MISSENAPLKALDTKLDHFTTVIKWLKNDEEFARIPGTWDSLLQSIRLEFSNEKNKSLCMNDYGLRIQTEEKELGSLMTIEAFCGSEEMFHLARSETIIYLHRKSEIFCEYLGVRMVSDDINPVLRQVLHRVIAKDPQLKKSYTRRLLVTAMNGCLSTFHLKQADPEALKSVNDDVNLSFKQASRVDPNALRQALGASIQGYRLNLKRKMRESNLVNSFWGAAMMQFFNERGISTEFEWNPKNLSKRFDNRFVDCVVLTQVGDQSIPILLMEAGLRKIVPTDEHKDMVKTSVFATICCFRMMEALEKQRKNPEQARCYALLAGGTGAQCLVAHPVKSEDRWYIQVSSDEGWYIDVACDSISKSVLPASTPTPDANSSTQAKSDDASEKKPAAKSAVSSEMASAAELERIVNNSLRESFLQVNKEKNNSKHDKLSLTVNATTNQGIIIGEDDYDYEDCEDEDEEVSTSSSDYTPPPSTSQKRGASDLNRPAKRSKSAINYANGPSLVGMQRLFFFFTVVLKRIQLLDALEASHVNPNSEHYLWPPTPQFNVPQGRQSAYTDPQNHARLGKGLTFNPQSSGSDFSSPTRKKGFLITKKYAPSIEHDIYNLASRCGLLFFARTYLIKPDFEAGETSFEFEHMAPMTDQNEKAYCIPCPKMFPTTIVLGTRLANGLKFALDTLVGLNCLHQIMGVLHCNISISSFMYSFVDNCWKIHDFQCSNYIESCAKKEWKCGTERFMAPEVIAEGRLSEASDLYSLGRVFQFLIAKLPIEFSIYSPLKLIRDEFVKLIFEMTTEDPQKRPSVYKAVEVVLRLWKQLAPNHQDFVVRAAEEIVAYKEWEQVKRENFAARKEKADASVNETTPVTGAISSIEPAPTGSVDSENALPASQNTQSIDDKTVSSNTAETENSNVNLQ